MDTAQLQLHLLEPRDGAHTERLQCYQWPLGEEAVNETAPLPITWDKLTEVAADRSLPRPVTFSWALAPAAPANVRYEILLATEPALRHPRRLTGLTMPYAEIRHLHLGTRYYWQVTATVGADVLATSPVWSFTTDSTPPRWIYVPGMTNVRDLGGWPLHGGGVVRQGMVYRTSEMNAHLHITEDGKQLLLDELGIRTDLDLRGETERPRPALDKERVRWVNVPVHPYAKICDTSPFGMPAYRRLFALLADPAHYPLIFHCWGGADRAGTLAFLLGALLGMRLDDLIRDYELTSLSVWGVRTRASLEFSSLLETLRTFHPDMADVQAQVEAYLAYIGVTPAEIAAIRAALVEEPEGER